ncbi:hypothetical protein HPB50_008408 [Hyalomma asiaticum]|uniref:Uncharacterized protein n=1 Tax=Hyalomma asiaticum TaxID=266040 RepID=A0ACB7RMJ7_HYAAI|nr:hypothetical protein HPB50_008408 [Hyalomma asiaticum]
MKDLKHTDAKATVPKLKSEPPLPRPWPPQRHMNLPPRLGPDSKPYIPPVDTTSRLRRLRSSPGDQQDHHPWLGPTTYRQLHHAWRSCCLRKEEMPRMNKIEKLSEIVRLTKSTWLDMPEPETERKLNICGSYELDYLE